jgi:hypothetical protein
MLSYSETVEATRPSAKQTAEPLQARARTTKYDVLCSYYLAFRAEGREKIATQRV